jgi:hypothetical protein
MQFANLTKSAVLGRTASDPEPCGPDEVVVVVELVGPRLATPGGFVPPPQPAASATSPATARIPSNERIPAKETSQL